MSKVFKDSIMSAISSRHQVIPFIAGKTAPFAEQRLSKVGYKTTSKTPAKYPSICASVPKIRADWITEQNVKRLEDQIKNLLQDAQDGILKSLYESSDGTLSGINDSDISFDACVNFMNAELAGDKLTIESINQWFDSQVKDNLTIVIAERLKFDLSTPEQESEVSQYVKGYRGLIASLSGNKTILQPVQIAGLKRALDISSVEDEMSKKLYARLDSMGKKPVLSELLDLG